MLSPWAIKGDRFCLDGIFCIARKRWVPAGFRQFSLRRLHRLRAKQKIFCMALNQQRMVVMEAPEDPRKLICEAPTGRRPSLRRLALPQRVIKPNRSTL